VCVCVCVCVYVLACLLMFVVMTQNLQRDWNEEFQSLYDLPVFTTEDVAKANRAKADLFRDFLQFSRDVAIELVAQLNRPRTEWALQPLDVQAGLAGGEKYVVGKLFCKFARDDKNIYRGNDELAIKMAKNELRNGNAVLQLRLHSLHLSMMACHRVQGHAVITSAMLPIANANTLVYGSADAARTVAKLDDHMTALIDRVGAEMNLLQHCIRGQNATMRLAIGADCEGHISRVDGRL